MANKKQKAAAKEGRRKEKLAKAPAPEQLVAALRERFKDPRAALLMREGGFAEVKAICPTGIEVLDHWVVGIGGLPYGQVTELYGSESSGKAQPVDCGVLTPMGFRRIGDLRVGDAISTVCGGIARVEGVYPQGMKPVFRIGFSDETFTESCGEHLWWTQSERERAQGIGGSVKPLVDVASTLSRPMGEGEYFVHRVPEPSPVEFFPRGPLLLDPYLLGALLGDGSLSRTSSITFHKPEADVIENVLKRLPSEDEGVQIDRHQGIRFRRKVRRWREGSGVKCRLGDLDLLGTYSTTKFIPLPYLFASIEDRRALLAGLFDTDGSVSNDRVDYSTSSPHLRDGVAFVARSLGARVRVATRTTRYSYNGEKRSGAPSYRLTVFFPDGFIPVTSKKHLARWAPGDRPSYKSVTSIVPAGEKECVCIRVGAADSLYVTDDFIVTHNTTLLSRIMGAAQRDGALVAFTDAETKFVPAWGALHGIDVGALVQVDAEHLEAWQERADYLLGKVPKGKLMLTLDSIASLPTKNEMEGKGGGQAEHARVWTEWGRQFKRKVYERQALVVWVNQPRSKPGVMYGPDETTFGGRWLRHVPLVRLAVFRGKNIKEGEANAGNYVHIRAEKNQLASPGRKAILALKYASGFDDDWATLDHAKTMGCIAKDAANTPKNVREARANLGWPAAGEPDDGPPDLAVSVLGAMS